MMRSLVADLCSEPCAGRAPGTPEGLAARRVVLEALRSAGLDPHEQPVPGCRGANVLAKLDGDIDRYVVVGAHFDHLGRHGQKVFWGADDNAAAVAILVQVASALTTHRPDGRGVIIAAFDGEEPPHFQTNSMGSQHFVQHPTVPLPQIDMMVCMDLVGHAFGPETLPPEVRTSLFALGAERSPGTPALVDSISEPGVVIRRADAEIVPPLSDYDPFWRRKIPFLFLTSGRWRHYHTPQDTPEKLDYPKMEATARWLERYVRQTCARPNPIAFESWSADDTSTLTSLIDILTPLTSITPEAEMALSMANDLLSATKNNRLPAARRPEVAFLIEALETRLA